MLPVPMLSRSGLGDDLDAPDLPVEALSQVGIDLAANIVNLITEGRSR